jgi:hypothetical protein
MTGAMLQPADGLWNLTQKGGSIDPGDLAKAIESALVDPELDERTRLLICEGAMALEKRWGASRFAAWQNANPRIAELRKLNAESESHFPSLERRVVETTKPEAVERFLRDLSTHVPTPTDLYIGDSIVLILAGHLRSRHLPGALSISLPANRLARSGQVAGGLSFAPRFCARRDRHLLEQAVQHSGKGPARPPNRRR